MIIVLSSHLMFGEICDIFMVTKNMFGKKYVVTSCRDVTGMGLGNQSQTADHF